MTATPLATKIDAILFSAVETGALVGASAAAATVDEVLYTGAFGQRRTTPPEPLEVDTVCWVASMTKLITITGALQLVESGALSLDAPISTLIPELEDPGVIEGFDGDEPVVRPAARPLTLRHLLTHTSGFGYHFWHADVKRYQEVKGLPGIIECKLATLTTPLTFDPGDGWEYGPNIEWVGIAIERATGQGLEAYLEEKVLAPLGMRSTRYRLTDDDRRRLAAVYARGEDDSLTQIDFEIPQDPEYLLAGGGMYSTLDDYLTLLRCYLNEGTWNGVEILKADTVREAMRNQVGELEFPDIATTDPGSSHDIALLPGVTKRWNLLGMTNETTTAQGRTAGSLFWAGLGNTYFWVDPGNGDCGVVFSQILPFGDKQTLAVLDQVEAEVHASRQPAAL